MKKMSDRDKKLLYYIGAILIIVAAYFLVFQKFNTKTADLKTQNDQLTTEVATLENMVAGKQGVLDDTAQKQQDIANVLQKFPAEVRTQNAIYNLNKMYKGISDVKIQSEGYNMNQVFYQPGAMNADGTMTAPAATLSPGAQTSAATVSAITSETTTAEIVSAATNYIGYRSDVTVAFTAPYTSLKKVVDYINESEDRMTITDISATKAEDSDNLTCNMTVSMYAIAGTGESYDDLNINGVTDGKSDIFEK